MEALSDKEQNIECYTNLYKSVHGVKPRGMDLYNWTNAELEQGMRVLNLNLTHSGE